jgi:hypothetical protein
VLMVNDHGVFIHVTRALSHGQCAAGLALTYDYFAAGFRQKKKTDGSRLVSGNSQLDLLQADSKPMDITGSCSALRALAFPHHTDDMPDFHATQGRQTSARLPWSCRCT